MGDTMPSPPDYQCLFDIAVSQHGHFTSAQARACGFTWERLSDVTRRGRFIRVQRGIYRLRDYPWYPREEVVSAWLALGKDTAVISHESALDLLELSDVIPNATHLTVPRTKRHIPPIPGVKVHTTTRPFGPLDIVVHDGMRVTSAARTILDAAEAGTGPEQVEMAIQQALDRGLATKTELLDGARHRGQRVQRLVHGALR
jgi:predicted transcriptional regulator of viral defense system